MPAYEPGSGEILVNQATAGDQNPTSIVLLANGSYLITSSMTEGEGQLFAPDGSKIGGPIDFSGPEQGAVVATALAGGGFVVTWVQGNSSAPNANVATFQVYDGFGVPAGPPVTAGQSGTPTLPDAFALQNGNFVATWWVGLDRFAQIFSSQGQQVSAPFEIHDRDSGEPSIVSGLTAGGFVEFYGVSQMRTAHAAFYDADGVLVRDVAINAESEYVATPLAGGGLVILQDRIVGTPPKLQWVTEIYDSAGQEITEIVANVDILSNPLALPDGGYAVMRQIGSARSLALFDGLGQSMGTIAVPVSLPNGGTLTLLTNGDVLLTWRAHSLAGDTDVKAIAIDLDGSVGTAFTVNEMTAGNQFLHRVLALPDGDFAITWADDSGVGGDASGAGVKTRFFRAAGPEQLGTSGNDTLAGNAPGGRDTMIGMAGDDIYYVDNQGDIVRESVGQGFDTVRASVSYTLTGGSEIEVLATADPSGTGAIDLTGNEFAQSIFGNAGANVLRGRGGNDTYHVDVNDIVHEAAGEGVDTVLASESYGLIAGSRIEFLSTSDAGGTAAINLFGNEFAQTITGNAGSNYLFGRGGGDTLVGLGGDDFLFVQSGDVVTEIAGGGYDNVLASASYTLNAFSHVEVLSTTNHGGTAAINLTGNEIGQAVIGNAGSNLLNGGGGADTLIGLGGDDFLYVDADDSVVESAGGGYDNVLASATYTLTAGAHVEILSTTNHGGTAAIALTGNELGQAVIGNAGANVLNGGLGADTLLGLGGADSFAFTTALGSGNVDNLADFSAADDTILLDNAVFAGLTDGALPASAFVTGSSAGDADDRIVYNSATGQIFFDADGNGAGAQVLFATVSAGTILTASDFIVI